MANREALAFDLYGTLIDPISIRKQLEQHFSHDAQHIAQLWRQTQLEFAFLLTIMEQYEDFEQVTRKALDYALAATGHGLDERQKQALMLQYNQLEPFPDVIPGLQRLKEAGYTMVVFSNGAPAQLSALMKFATLDRYCTGFVSVDEVQAYKPSPKVYQHVASRLGRSIETVRLVSSNPFDVIGARAAGMQTSWINRSGGIFSTLASPPQSIVRTLIDLADVLRTEDTSN